MPGCPVQAVEDGARFVRREHRRQSPRRLGAHQVRHPGDTLMEHLAIQKQQSGERLILCRRADPALDGEVREKCRHLRLTQLGGCRR